MLQDPPVIQTFNTLLPAWDRPGMFVANLFSLFFGNENQTKDLCTEVGRLETYGGRLVHHADVTTYRSVITNGRIIGPGAGDMKGQLAILMVLFRRFHRAMKGVRLGLAVTTDEETGGAHGVGYLVNKCGLRCGSALIPDGG